MALFFFDVHDGDTQFDTDGTECSTLEEAEFRARCMITEAARSEVDKDGDRNVLVVVVADERHRVVYTATLTLIGFRLTR